MEDLVRLIISNERIVNKQNNDLELRVDEAHYLTNVMRVKTGQKIFITNGEGSLWKALKVKDNLLEIIQFDKPFFFQEREILSLGIAVVVPKKGFEDILKMSTEIGIDLIQPLFSERQNNKKQKKIRRKNNLLNKRIE